MCVSMTGTSEAAVAAVTEAPATARKLLRFTLSIVSRRNLRVDIVSSPMSEHSKFLLADGQIPTVWVNVLPSLPEPMDPPLHPGTHAPLTPQDLAPLFPMELIEQEFSPHLTIDIPG